jgi:hypothetical protein
MYYVKQKNILPFLFFLFGFTGLDWLPILLYKKRLFSGQSRSIKKKDD